MRSRLIPLVGVLMIVAAAGLGALALNRGQGWTSVGVMGGGGSSSGTSISMDRAQQSVQSFVDRTGNKELHIDELMEFDQNFYALIKERSTGIGAFELLVNKHTAAVVYEPGPDMMWNAKYSVMGAGGNLGSRGPMGFRVAPGVMAVSGERATRIAQSWLDQHTGGSSAGTADAFYGYYTFHFLSGGQIVGMLSVNGSNGQVWPHNWHGRFIQGRDLGS